jgi:hypothetical protein
MSILPGLAAIAEILAVAWLLDRLGRCLGVKPHEPNWEDDAW